MPEIVYPRRIVFGEPVDDALISILEYYGYRKVLIVTDRRVTGLGFYDRILKSLSLYGAEYIIYDKVEPEPRIDNAIDGFRALNGFRPEAVVAIGGGSVIDVAKSIYIMIKVRGIELREIAPFNPLSIEYHPPILIAIPTTSGSGSDASYGIVLTDEVDGRSVKMAVANPEIVPHVTILDPGITMDMPRELTIGSALDALSHAIEAYVSRERNIFTDMYCIEATLNIFKYLPIVVDSPRDYDARMYIHYSATMAGIAFTNAGLGLAHAIAHPLGAMLKIHHGTIVGLVLPYIVEYNYDSSLEARARYDSLSRLIESRLGLRERPLHRHLMNLYDRIGHPTRISGLGINIGDLDEVIKQVAEEALHDPTIVYNPVEPSMEDILEILRRMI